MQKHQIITIQEKQNQLTQALLKGNFELVIKLEKEGASFFNPDSYGCYPLVAAVYGCNLELVIYIEKKLKDEAINQWHKVDTQEFSNKLNSQMPTELSEEATYKELGNWYKKYENTSWCNIYDKSCLEKEKCEKWKYITWKDRHIDLTTNSLWSISVYGLNTTEHKLGNSVKENNKLYNPSRIVHDEIVKRIQEQLNELKILVEFKVNQKKQEINFNQGILNISINIPYSELKFDKLNDKIGEGGFGYVYKGMYQYTAVAIKQLRATIITEDLLEEFKRELLIATSVASPYAVRVYGACFENPNYALVIEFMDGGDLFRTLGNGKSLEWNIRYQIGLDVSYGLSYLHNKGIIHCDLKSLNILLDKYMRAKVTDFGISKVKISSSATTLIGPDNIGGTTRWMAPELFQGEKNTKASDVYGYGMILWELGARKIPFKNFGNEQIPFLVTTQKKREKISNDTPLSMAKLISVCWDERKEKRPNMDEAIKLLEAEQQQLGYKK